jgi:hypothetical protein
MHEREVLRRRIFWPKREEKESQYLSGIALGYGLDDRGFESRQGLGIFLSSTATLLPLEPTQPPIQCVPGTLSLGIKRLGRGAIPPLTQYAFMAWCSAKSTGTTLHLTEKVVGSWREMHLYSFLNIIRVMEWVGHTACMGEMRNAYEISVSKFKGVRPNGSPNRRCELWTGLK